MLFFEIFPIKDISTSDLADEPFFWRLDRLQKRMQIWEEVDVRIKSIAVWPLHRHDDDKPVLCDPAKLRDRLWKVKDVFERVCADDRIKRIIFEW